ncbi:MAG TPA: methyltransferase domain-containing protein [Herpetosiphonaceae bacterium]|nr:methyltransferase domain-containing protein [Herpetosiphonaceae bacterium]
MTHRAAELFRTQRLRWRQRLRRLRRPARLGTLRRTTPLSSRWGYDRGTPVDRFYIERFLEQHQDDIHGRVLEIKDSGYTDRFGRHVESREVLDVDAANPRATVVADLAAADAVPSDHFDCFVCTQTLGMIYDVRSAVGHAHRILRPGGVLLATLPALSRLDRRLPDYWRFTPASCELLFGEVFGPANVAVQAHGNVLAAIASMSGMAREELSLREMETSDERYPLVVTVRAVKR